MTLNVFAQSWPSIQLNSVSCFASFVRSTFTHLSQTMYVRCCPKRSCQLSVGTLVPWHFCIVSLNSMFAHCALFPLEDVHQNVHQFIHNGTGVYSQNQQYLMLKHNRMFNWTTPQYNVVKYLTMLNL